VEAGDEKFGQKHEVVHDEPENQEYDVKTVMKGITEDLMRLNG
jgi:hypothetical protein